MSLSERADFSYIRYSNCWEDAAVLMSGLDVREGGRYLSITSGGDNSLAMLAHAPEQVLSLDLNPAQTALATLKKFAFYLHSHQEMLRFLGFTDAGASERVESYRVIEGRLPEEARVYWNERLHEVERGVIHLGKFERYFRIFRTRVLPLVHRRSRVEALLEPRDRAGREEFYSKRWDTVAWRAIFSLFFSKPVMGRLGRDPEFFRHVAGPVSQRILARTRDALTRLSVADNPFVRYILTGRFGDALPDYARRENFESIRENLDALEIVTGDLIKTTEEMSFDGMNLSDIFEYMTPEETHGIASILVDRLRPEGRMVYWEMLAERDISKMLPDDIIRLDRLSEELHGRDRAFFYQDLHVMRKNRS